MDLSSHNETFKSIEQEFVEEIDVARAYIILFNMQVNNWADVYLFCACINLINTYVKQPNRKVGYSFKSRIYFLADVLTKTHIEGIKLDNKVSPADCLFVVNIFNVQFSFHNVRLNEDTWKLLKEYQAQLPWDRIRKQKCANTVFKTAYDLLERTNLTKYQENLNDYMEKIIEMYKEGTYILEKRGLININGTFC